MLQKQAIEPGTLSVLEKLMQIPELNNFSLVGGTAIALKYGHRKSIDLDLFSPHPFDKQTVINTLTSQFQEGFEYDGSFSKWGIFCYINDIKVDIIHYPHPLIDEVIISDKIRLAGDKDLIAMKLQAVLGRGVKKDFYDIAEFFNHYAISEMIELHKEKYPNQMLGISIPQALIYFEDAEKNENPVVLNSTSWDDVKDVIKQKVSEFLK